MLHRVLHFYSTWASVLHLLHLLGYIKSTWIIAVFVFVIGTILVLRKSPFPTEYAIHAIHIIPLLLIKDRTIHWDTLVYILLFFSRVYCIYDNMYDYRIGNINCS